MDDKEDDKHGQMSQGWHLEVCIYDVQVYI